MNNLKLVAFAITLLRSKCFHDRGFEEMFFDFYGSLHSSFGEMYLLAILDMGEYIIVMKMTMNIDEKVLKEVMESYDLATKTDAVDFALKELVRLEKLRKMGREGWGFTPQELKDSVDPNYDVDAMRVAESPEEYDAIKKTYEG